MEQELFLTGLTEEAGARVYILDPVATGNADADHYEKAMRRNLEVLKEALGSRELFFFMRQCAGG